MRTEFEERMGVSWDDDHGNTYYGLVISCEDDGIVNVVQVDPLTPGIHCYDEGLDYNRDKDNVRLDDAPPPFAFLCIRDGVSKCYAFAQVNTPIPFYPDELDALMITDGGEKVSEADFYTVFNHPWPEQPELERMPVKPEPAAASETGRPKRGSAFSELMAAVSARPEDEDEKDTGPDFW